MRNIFTAIIFICLYTWSGCKTSNTPVHGNIDMEEEASDINLKLLGKKLLGENATFEIGKDPELVLFKNSSLESGGLFFLVYDQTNKEVIYDGTSGVVTAVNWEDEEKLWIKPARRISPEDSKPDEYYLNPRTGKTEALKISY